jgi:hypothetical protein
MVAVGVSGIRVLNDDVAFVQKGLVVSRTVSVILKI